MFNFLFSQEMFVLFTILAIGAWLGHLSFRGTTLGSAGVLITALVFGHYGLKVPNGIPDLGIILFSYSAGLQVGPSFFRIFRRRGVQYVIIGLATAVTGALATIGAAVLFHFPMGLASGLFNGALTCTPALAAAIDVVERIASGESASVSVGCGAALPISLIGFVLLVQFFPKIIRRRPQVEEARSLEEKRSTTPDIEVRHYIISNPDYEGKAMQCMS